MNIKIEDYYLTMHHTAYPDIEYTNVVSTSGEIKIIWDEFTKKQHKHKTLNKSITFSKKEIETLCENINLQSSKVSEDFSKGEITQEEFSKKMNQLVEIKEKLLLLRDL